MHTPTKMGKGFVKKTVIKGQNKFFSFALFYIIANVIVLSIFHIKYTDKQVFHAFLFNIRNYSPKVINF